jgi:hypothetical protein
MPGFWENLFGAGITAGGLALGAKAYDQLGETGERAYQEFARRRWFSGHTLRYAGVSTVHCYFCYWWSVWHVTGPRDGSNVVQTLLLLLKNRLSSSKP